jgi:hypothetical protein
VIAASPLNTLHFGSEVNAGIHFASVACDRGFTAQHTPSPQE